MAETNGSMVIEKVSPSNDEIDEMCFQLAQKITQHCADTNERFHGITFASRGGLAVANTVARCLGFRGQNLFNMGLGLYPEGSTQASDSIEVGQMPDPDMLAGKNWIHLDEVHDTGGTTEFAHEYHQKAGSALVRFGVLHFKPVRNTSLLVPDWYIEETANWIEYPWEKYEDIGQEAAKQVRAE